MRQSSPAIVARVSNRPTFLRKGFAPAKVRRTERVRRASQSQASSLHGPSYRRWGIGISAVANGVRCLNFGHPADWKSATQPVRNPRYLTVVLAFPLPVFRLLLCYEFDGSY